MALTNLYPSLAGKAVYVTGGGSGIGAHIVEHFLRQKARVVFIDVDEAASRKLIGRCRGEKLGEPVFQRCDVRDVPALQASLRQAAEALGRLDVLVNNAARDDRHAYDTVTVEIWDNTLNVNLRPHFFTMQAAAPFMERQGGGSIVNLGSVSWMQSLPGLAGYTTAKGGISALTRCMAKELGGMGIRVNSVVPGAVVTPRQQALWLNPAKEQEFIDLQSLKFRIQPDDVVAMVLFLASDDSRACTGQDYLVDAGIV